MAKDVIMPVLGMNQDTAVLLAWLKNEGDQVEEGEPIMEVETDKATMELDAPASGTLANVTAQAGEEVRVGSTIAVIVADGEAAPSVTPTGAPATPAPEPPAATPTPVAADGETARGPSRSGPSTSLPPSPATQDGSSVSGKVGPPRDGAFTPDGVVLASPKARRLAAENGVTLARLQGLGSGPEGALLAADVLRSAALLSAESGAEGAPTAGEPLARAQAPTASFTVEREVEGEDLASVLAWAHERGSTELTFGDLLARFAVAVWHRYPLAGSSPSVTLDYYQLLPADEDTAMLHAHVLDAHQSSLQAIAAARLAAGNAANQADSIPDSAPDLALVDLTESRLDRGRFHASGALATVVGGRLQQRVIAVDGSPAVHVTLPLTVVFDASRVALDEAAVWADRLVGLIEAPSDLLILY